MMKTALLRVPTLRRFFSSIPNVSSSPLRIAVCGSGRMGEIRASLLAANPRFHLVGIVDPNIDAARALAERSETRAFTSLAEIAAVDRMDGIVVSTPTFTHTELIQQAEEYNSKAVLVEKPVEETADKIAELFDASNNNNNITICCSFQRRFDPSYVRAHQLVQDGAIGRPISAQLFFADHPAPPLEFLKAGGNIFMDLSAHDVDYITNLVQDRVVSVYAVASCSDPVALAGVQDNASIILNFAQGATAHLFMSRSASYGYDQRCQVFGTIGKVQVGNQHTTSTVLANADGYHQDCLLHSFPQRFRQAFGLELEAFGNVLQGTAVWPVTRAQCVHVQRVADAARQSAATGMVVKVEEEGLVGDVEVAAVM